MTLTLEDNEECAMEYVRLRFESLNGARTEFLEVCLEQEKSALDKTIRCKKEVLVAAMFEVATSLTEATTTSGSSIRGVHACRCLFEQK